MGYIILPLCGQYRNFQMNTWRFQLPSSTTKIESFLTLTDSVQRMSSSNKTGQTLSPLVLSNLTFNWLRMKVHCEQCTMCTHYTIIYLSDRCLFIQGHFLISDDCKISERPHFPIFENSSPGIYRPHKLWSTVDLVWLWNHAKTLGNLEGIEQWTEII